MQGPPNRAYHVLNSLCGASPQRGAEATLLASPPRQDSALGLPLASTERRSVRLKRSHAGRARQLARAFRWGARCALGAPGLELTPDKYLPLDFYQLCAVTLMELEHP